MDCLEGNYAAVFDRILLSSATTDKRRVSAAGLGRRAYGVGLTSLSGAADQKLQLLQRFTCRTWKTPIVRFNWRLSDVLS